MEAEARRLFNEFVECSDGAKHGAVVLACANLIGHIYVQSANTVDDADKAVDSMSATIKAWVRANWELNRATPTRS